MIDRSRVLTIAKILDSGFKISNIVTKYGASKILFSTSLNERKAVENKVVNRKIKGLKKSIVNFFDLKYIDRMIKLVITPKIRLNNNNIKKLKTKSIVNIDNNINIANDNTR